MPYLKRAAYGTFHAYMETNAGKRESLRKKQTHPGKRQSQTG